MQRDLVSEDLHDVAASRRRRQDSFRTPERQGKNSLAVGDQADDEHRRSDREHPNRHVRLLARDRASVPVKP